MNRLIFSAFHSATGIVRAPYSICRPLALGNKSVDVATACLFCPARCIKIYTRTGDSGKSSLFNGERRAKTDDVFHALGSVDELSSAIGVAVANLEGINTVNNKYDVTLLKERLDRIQCLLQDVGSCVATPIEPRSSETGEIRPKRYSRIQFHESSISDLEMWIDEMTSVLPPLRQFILPSGGLAAANLHLCRSVCRRAERTVVILNSDAETPSLEPEVINSFRAYSGDRYGSGKGKGGGSGGAVRDAGGSLGEREAANEEVYFKKMQAKQIEELKKHIGTEVAHHESEIKRHKEVIERHRKKLKELDEND